MIVELYLNSRYHEECDDETFEGEDEPGFVDELLEARPVDCLKLEELRFDIELDDLPGLKNSEEAELAKADC